jgi:glutamine---fructose-6-phosphate transaminase (isomerizing)
MPPMTPMMEEVFDQPRALADVRKYYTSPGAIPFSSLQHAVTHWPPTVVFTGMGSSLFAAYPAQAFLTSVGVRALVWETAELLHHHLRILKPDTLLVVVSQSGETVEVTRLLENLPKRAGLVGVVNVESSALGRRVDLLLPMLAGRQRSVSTRTYTTSVAVLMYLAFAIAREPHRPLTEILVQAIEAEEQVLEHRKELTVPTAEFFGLPPYVSLMSRGADLSTAYQGALMFKEVVRLAAEPMSAAQFRHGPIEIIQPAHRYIIIARRGPAPHGRGRGPARVSARRADPGQFLVRLAGDIRAHGGRVLLVTDIAGKHEPDMRVIKVEPIGLGLGTLVDSVYIQLLVHELALRAGLEPGKFWIAQDVTREE